MGNGERAVDETLDVDFDGGIGRSVEGDRFIARVNGTFPSNAGEMIEYQLGTGPWSGSKQSWRDEVELWQSQDELPFPYGDDAESVRFRGQET